MLTPDELKKSSAGRKPFDAILMFRMLVLQALNNLSDEQVEYQVRDRLSFSRFLGLAIEDSIPDATTLWLFRENPADLFADSLLRPQLCSQCLVQPCLNPFKARVYKLNIETGGRGSR